MERRDENGSRVDRGGGGHVGKGGGDGSRWGFSGTRDQVRWRERMRMAVTFRKQEDVLEEEEAMGLHRASVGPS